jgi:hypothetical protein
MRRFDRHPLQSVAMNAEKPVPADTPVAVVENRNALLN